MIDPYRTGTAEVADIHLMPRPGTDGALACAVMHVLFKEGFADRAYLARYTDVPDELEAHLRARDAGLGRGDHRPVPRRRSSISPGSMAAPSAASSASATASPARATVRRSCTRSPACRR